MDDDDITVGACVPPGMPWWNPWCSCGESCERCPVCDSARCRANCKPHIHEQDD